MSTTVFLVMMLVALGVANVVLNILPLISKDDDDTNCTPKNAVTIPGVANERILLGMATDYPPYTKFDPDGSSSPIELSGFNKEFIDLITPICGIKADAVLAPWSDCWTTKPSKVYFDEVTEYIGEGIWEGRVHGCTAYTHTKGERGLSLEFTHSILGGLKRAGVLTRLVGGKPVVSPQLDDYTSVAIGDVSGWAPTPDTFKFNINMCTGNQFKSGSLIAPAAGDGNENAINALLNGTFDALYLYADQLENFKKSGTAAEKALAAGLGAQFAYIHTGLNGWSFNGTTLAISKRGSGLKELLDPCIEKIVKTKEYTTMCESYWSPSTCIQNDYSTGTATEYFYDKLMNERADTYTCSDGYCTCSELP